MPRRPDTFGARVRRARQAKGLSQSDLARAVGTGRNWIWKIERDEYAQPWIDTIQKLAAALGVEPGELDPRLLAMGAKP